MNSSKPIVAFNDAFAAAAHAAVSNAGKSGPKTSEFWVSVGAAAASTLCALLVPTPFGLIAAGAIGVASAAYSMSRGNVKAAALAGLGSAAAATSQAAGVPPAVAAAAGAVGAIVGAEQASGQTPGQ